MFNLRRNFRRRLFINHKHGALAVRIDPTNDRTLYIGMLVVFTAGFLVFMYIFIHPFFRGASAKNFLYVLPFLGFILMWYAIGLRITLWRAFGVELIVVEDGLLHWTRTALFWTRKFDIPAREITDVTAITPWHGLSNHVQVTAQGRSRSIGDMLLSDEASELAHKIDHAIKLAR